MRLLFPFLSLLIAVPGLAKDVHVKGYYRSNGTYVQPHIRSSPDSVKWNNYGSNTNGNGYQPASQRDADGDGTPNYRDYDDDNDGLYDDYDSN